MTRVGYICMEETEKRHIPLIGLMFISRARTLVASSHSFVNVFGGGGAMNDTYIVR
jgi:hypothetical protein